ncbi:MAG: glycosyltransferase [bacterium]|nr:glycosyltransferase [bacterium]
MKKPVRILRIVPSLEMGGVERTLTSILPRLDKCQYKVYLCCLFKRDKLADIMESLGIPIIKFRMRARLDFDGKYIAGILRLARLMKKMQIDIVHTHLYRANLAGRIAAKLAGIPVIITNEHNIDSWKKFPQRLSDRVLAGITNKIIAVSDAVKDFYVKKIGISEDKIITIYNGVDISKFQTYVNINKKREEFGIKPDEKIITIIGRLQQQKGHVYFLKAAQIIRKKKPNVKFLVVGDGPLESQLKTASDDLGISKNVIFTGLREDIPQILAMSDISVLTSLREGFSITVLESMAAGKPVVVTDVGGNSEVVKHGETGFIIPPQSPEDLALYSLNLINNQELAKKMGEEAEKRVLNFSIDRMVEKTENLYTLLLRRVKLDKIG